ncbi:MAG: NAD(P)/FAD-dependent oxidoreductase [Qingshengfaniella sp.]
MDATIFGAGIFGLTVALALARRGLRVRVIDPGGVAAGASGGIVGALAPHVPERWNAKKAMQFEALMAAPAYWAGVEALSGQRTGFARLGRLQPIADAAALDRAEARAAEAAVLWQGQAGWTVIRADEAGDFAPLTPTGILIHDTLTARLHPRRACQALAAALTTLGGEVVAQAPITAGPVIHATGWQGLATLAADLERPVGVGVKGQAVLMRHNAGRAPQLFADGLHIVPHDDGTVAIGSTTERDFDDPHRTDDQTEALVARARALCPPLADAPVIARWAGVRPRARTRAPMIGPWPRRAGHYVSNGGFKIGLAMAPMAADMLADLIVDGTDRIPKEFRVEASME